ncbi:MAG: ABC transporter permease [Myxococcales bacterium]|nr:ABC transporter permease [Myxococcales bacterium]
MSSESHKLSPSAWIGIALMSTFLLLAIFGPWLAPYSVVHQDLDARFLGPSTAHWLGTDQHGIDTLSQVLHGTRIAAMLSASVVSICAVTGTLLGVVAGYYRGVVDEIVMRIVDVLLAFPGILLNIAIVALVATPGIGTMIIALCVNGWVRYARLARGQVLAMRELEYVSAARAIGARSSVVMFRHILPNMLSPIVVMMSLSFGGVIAVEASLSFLGLGPQLDYSWGSLLDQGTTFSLATPRLALIPGIAIMIVVLGSNLLGDGLRDYYDPKGRR